MATLMDIRTALDSIVTLEQGLSITSPVSVTTKKVYKYMPSQSQVVQPTPAWANTWRLDAVRRGPSVREQQYTVTMQLFVHDASLDRAADIATAFHVALIDALDADLTLGGTVKEHQLGGGDATLAVLEWAGRSYIGLNERLVIVLREGASFS